MAHADDASNYNYRDAEAFSLTVAGPLTVAAPSGQQAVKAGGTLSVNGVSLTDPGLPTSENVTMTLAVINGTVMISTSVSGGVASGQVTANGTSSVTVTAPLAAINATLADANGLVYSPNAGFNGLDSLALQATDTVGHEGMASVSIATGLTVNVPSAQVAKANGILAISGVSISDPGLSTTGNLTLTFSANHGTVNLSTAVSGGVTSGEIIGNGSGAVTVMAPLAAVNATLAATSGLTYTPTSGFAGSDLLALSVVDSLESTNSTSVPLAVAGPLTVTAPTTTQALVGGTVGITGISLADPSLPLSDNVTATFTVTSGIVALSTTVTGGITSGQVTTNGTASVTVTAPLAAINATLALSSGLVYSPNSGFSGDDTLSISASDAIGNSATGNVALLVIVQPFVCKSDLGSGSGYGVALGR